MRKPTTAAEQGGRYRVAAGRGTTLPRNSVAIENEAPGQAVLDGSSYDEVAPHLAAWLPLRRPIFTWLGSDEFLSLDTPGSVEQAALGSELLAWMENLGIEKADPQRLRRSYSLRLPFSPESKR